MAQLMTVERSAGISARIERAALTCPSGLVRRG
jgi:hypothetical protein